MPVKRESLTKASSFNAALHFCFTIYQELVLTKVIALANYYHILLLLSWGVLPSPITLQVPRLEYHRMIGVVLCVLVCDADTDDRQLSPLLAACTHPARIS